MWIILVLIALISGIIAGMGVGGGSIFILLSTIFNVFEHKEAQSYNLIMFIVVGISATISNLKNKKLDLKMFKKLIIPVCIGSICGILLIKVINDKTLRLLFYIFMLVIGSYEIISSLKKMLSGKTNNE
mgnify:CR=1 FL=1